MATSRLTFSFTRIRTALLLLLCFMLLSLALPAPVAAGGTASVLTADHEPTVATEWMNQLYEIIRNERVNPPAAARIYGYAGVTLYEAVVWGMPENFTIAGQATEMPDLSLPDFDPEVAYDWPSVANAALATVINGLFPNGSQETKDAIDNLHASLSEARGAEVSEDVLQRSLGYGDTLGKEILKWVAADHYAETRDMVWETPTGEPFLWVPTSDGQVPTEPYWGMVRPFALSFTDVCAVDLDMTFSTDENSTFYAQAMEVKEAGDNLTEEQGNISRFWLDPPGQTGTPAGHWVMIETQLVEQLDLTLHRAAEMYALVNMALADSFISCWSLKYQVNLLRPVTYIQQYIRRAWQPYIQTPPFPEYPSGHSTASGAAAEILTTMFGQVYFTDSTPIINGHENLERSFTSFEAAASEAAISRLYGGIHYRVAIENGLRQGRCVGQQVLNNVRLRSVPQGE